MPESDDGREEDRGLVEISEAQAWNKKKRRRLKSLLNEVECAPHSGHCKGFGACTCWKLRAERLIYGLGGAKVKAS